MGFVIPQIVAASGAPFIGHNAIEPALKGDIVTAAMNTLANEALLFSGFDIQTGTWNYQAPLLNYGMMLGLPWVAKKIFKGRTVDIPMLGKVKVA
jgi:hypothetical protein